MESEKEGVEDLEVQGKRDGSMAGAQEIEKGNNAEVRVIERGNKAPRRAGHAA